MFVREREFGGESFIWWSIMKESETLEFKETTGQLNSSLKSISAMLNTHQRGEIIFGIDDKCLVKGMQISDKTIRSVGDAISQYIEPRIYPKMKETIIEGKNCLKIEFTGKKIPYYCDGRAYKRSGTRTIRMSPEEIEEVTLEKNKEKLRWDKMICENASLSDINQKTLRWFLKEAGKKFVSVGDSLEKLNLLEKEGLTNAGVMLFSKDPQQFFPFAKVRVATFATADASIPLDMKEFKGNIFSLIKDTEKYFLEHINIGMRLEGLKRIDIPEINSEAFREALLNSFSHRNYYLDQEIQVAIFKDKVQVRSPGLLPKGLTIEKIRTEEISRPRNPLIADRLHEIHWVEKWGQGIHKILSLEPETMFKEIADLFYVEFKRKNSGGVSGGGSGGGRGGGRLPLDFI